MMIRAIVICSECRTQTLVRVPRKLVERHAEVWFYCPICRKRVVAKDIRPSNIPAEPQEIAAR